MEPLSIIGTKNRKGQVITDPRVMMNEAPRTASFYTGSEVIKEAIRRASIDVMIADEGRRFALRRDWIGNHHIDARASNSFFDDFAACVERRCPRGLVHHDDWIG